MKRITGKMQEIGGFLDELEAIAPSSFDKYKSSIEKRAACERYVEKVVESVTDLAFLVIKYRKFRIPEDDTDAFNILLENKLIDGSLAAKMKDAKGMRNIIAHQYGHIDDELVFNSINELQKDVREFIERIKSRLS